MIRSKHPLYMTYSQMNQRCYNPNNPKYNDWGGRGITVCARWKRTRTGSGFWNFVEDMGNKPEGHSLDRRDNDGDYTPDNCRWVILSVQSHNTRSSKGSKSKYKGVCWDSSRGKKGKWKAKIMQYGILYNLGYFDDEILAAKAYDTKAIELYGKEAKPNF